MSSDRRFAILMNPASAGGKPLRVLPGLQRELDAAGAEHRLVETRDMAHATHPNYADRHEPGHQIALNGGPVLKVNSNVRYASDASSSASFVLACEKAGVPLQRYAHRSDLPCGSTIGPITAAAMGVATVDIGAPQLAMHSARELCGADDPGHYTAAMTAFLSPAD